MSTDFDEKRRKAYSGRRSVMDIGMGVVIAGFGVFFALAEKLGMKLSGEPLLRYVFAGMCLLYGFFRIYRGYKKNYYRE